MKVWVSWEILARQLWHGFVWVPRKKTILNKLFQKEIKEKIQIIAVLLVFMLDFLLISSSSYSHCAFSSNLFHGHITQKYIDQLSDPENKKM